jgi:intracellular sulfur oxidation DsrE/DsrF family protein
MGRVVSPSWALLLLLCGLALAPAGALADAGPPAQRVVYHVDTADADEQRATLRVIGNHLNDVGDENVEARVVLQGAGVSMLLPPGIHGSGLFGNAGDRTQVRIADLKVRGVNFYVCDSSLNRRGIEARDILYDTGPDEIVHSGLAEIVRLQAAGYTYVKL